MADSTARSQPERPQLPSIEARTANKIFKKRKVFNDPIHGQIELHPVCCLIIDTPQFQRLRHIKQLDTCYLVFPGASHNRFEHSIGVCYLAGKLLKTIRERQPDERITDKDILCVEIAGLCHDLGQGPFSHVFEKKFMPKMKSKQKEPSEKFTHEKIARKMLKFMLETENDRKLKKVIEMELKECGIPDFTDDDYTFIYEIIDDQKDLEQREWPYKGRGEDKSYMYEIVANKRNGIDVDKWDYLARDSYMLGINVNADYRRCFRSARVIKCNGIPRKPLRKQICYREKEAQGLYDMFYMRMTLHRRAYQHKTHKIIGLMICDALECADKHIFIKGKRISETVDCMKAYTYLTDDIIQLIMNNENKDLKEAQKILHDITYRRLYKCVKEERCNDVNLTEDDVINGIAEKLGRAQTPEKFIHCDIVKFNYGMDNNNPMEKVRFYKRDKLDKALSINKNQVSFILPDTFEESVIRIYCKIESEKENETAKEIEEAFDKWWTERGHSSSQGEIGDQTELKQLNESSQPSHGQGQIVPERSDDDDSVQELKEKPLPEPAPHGSIEEPLSYDGENIDQRSSEEEPSSQ